jgi:hypothetical protein
VPDGGCSLARSVATPGGAAGPCDGVSWGIGYP